MLLNRRIQLKNVPIMTPYSRKAEASLIKVSDK